MLALVCHQLCLSMHTHTHTYGVSSFSDWGAGCRVGIKMPTVTVQYADLGVDATVHVGSRALPSVWNSYRNTLEVLLTACMLICVLAPLPARIQDLSKLILTGCALWQCSEP